MKTSLPGSFARCYSRTLLIALALVISVFTVSSSQELWGVLSQGGADNLGTIGHFDVSTSSWITDYNFTIESKVTGRNPTTELTKANGKFYGMTAGGINNLGELFEWDPVTNAYATKVDFSLTLGSNPQGSLTYSEGKLYGVTSGGGTKKGGVLFEFDPSTSVYKKLLDLDGRPKGSLALLAGKLYGMTSIGGANGVGVIFEWNISTGVYSVQVDLNCINGCDPRGRLAYAEGKFYGITLSGGVNGAGAIFEWDPYANVLTKKFDLSITDGSNCYGSLTYQDGSLYGMTFYGGAHNAGVIFDYNLSTNRYTKKFDFGYGKGRNPKGSLVWVDGKLYGLTSGGGDEHGGTLFEYNPSTNTYLEKVFFSSHLIAPDGKNPRGSLAYSEGSFYGMTYWGGPSNLGILFEWNLSSNVFTKKLNFSSTTYTGRNSTGSLAYAGGKLYGITQGGITNAGAIFEWDPADQKYTRKVDFKEDEGGNEHYPQGSLIYNQGKLYGATKDFENFIGAIFEYNPAVNEYEEKVNLSCNNDNRCSPNSPSTFVDGKFYGTTVSGGVNDSGVLFEWDPVTNTYLTRIDFSNENGSNPYGALSYHDGKFYGMTSAGGANNVGVIFMWDPATNSYTKKVDFNTTDGSVTYGSLTLKDGKFYGMTYSGGVNDAGVIFEWNPATNVYTKKIELTSINGSAPKGSLTYSGGRFFGVTSAGGANGLGVLFEWDPLTNIYTKKVDFSTTTGGGAGYVQLLEVNPPMPISTPTIASDNINFSNVLSTTMTVSFKPGNGSHHLAVMKAGSAPVFLPEENNLYSGNLDNGESVVYSGIDSVFNLTSLQPNTEYFIKIFEFNTDSTTTRYRIENAPISSGRTRNMLQKLWGMTHEGGASGGGAIFKINTDGSNLSVVHSFDNETGGASRNSLIQTSDGLILGMTQAGGSTNDGVIFKIDENGSGYSVLHEFEGGWPMGSLIQASDGFIFGMNLGTIFKTNADGTNFNVLHNFDNTNGTNVAAGSLFQATDGSLYGMTNTFYEGPGTIFKINTDGSGFTVLSNFDSLDVYPWGSLTQGSDGALYGMTAKGGSSDNGTIFKINIDGSNYSVLHNFNASNGRWPYNGLTAAPDGWLYGMTYLGGDSDAGTLFKIRIDGEGFTVLHHFACANGCGSTGTVIIHQNKLFAYTTFGGADNAGVIFNYDLASETYNKLSDLNSSIGKEPMFGSLLLVNSTSEFEVESPTIPASDLSFSNVLSTSMTVSFKPGNGTGRLAVLKAGGPPTFRPLDNNSYFGKVANGEFIVFNGIENTFNINGLQAYRRYYVTIFEYNSDNHGNITYLLENAPVASQQTKLLPNVYLIKPGDGAVNQNVIITLKANTVEGATTYTFEVSNSSDFADSDILSGGITHLIDSLHYNTLYYARVKTNLRDDFGKITTFTTRTAESLAFVTWPANNEIDVPTKTAVASNSVPYASQYTIQLSETTDFSIIAFEVTGPTRILQFSGLKPNTTYYSRVLVNLSPVFGPARSFTTRMTSSTSMHASVIETDLGEFAIEVYPNPFQEKLNLFIGSSMYGEAKITLVDVNGRRIHESTVQTNAPVEIDEQLPNGVYFLRINTGGVIKMIRVLRVQ